MGHRDIWAGMGGNWSGLPSVHITIPSVVFYWLKDSNTEKTFGRLCTDDDVINLVEKTRHEIKLWGWRSRRSDDTNKTK